MSNDRDELLRALEAETRESTANGVVFLQAVAERSGLNLTDLQCINVLSATGPITAGQLAEEMRLTTGAITGLLNRLERAGYVRRAKDPEDGRRVVVELDAGAVQRGGAGILESQGKELMNALIAGYDDAELAVVLDFTRRSNALTREALATLRAEATGAPAAAAAASIAGVEVGRLVFTNGAFKLTLRAGDDLGDELFRARFEGPQPEIEVNDGVVNVRYGRRFKVFGGHGHPAEFVVNPAVPWAIEIRGGAAELNADLSGVIATAFSFSGGASSLRMTLAEPVGVVPIRFSGGANSITIRRPAGAAALLSIRGGFNAVTLDKQVVGAMGSKMQLQSPNGGDTPDRYEIEISGGANEVKVLS